MNAEETSDKQAETTTMTHLLEAKEENVTKEERQITLMSTPSSSI